MFQLHMLQIFADDPPLVFVKEFGMSDSTVSALVFDNESGMSDSTASALVFDKESDKDG